MKIIFSLLSVGLAIGIGVWWSLQSLESDAHLVTPTPQQDGTVSETPIDEAQKAKMLIESNNALLVE